MAGMGIDPWMMYHPDDPRSRMRGYDNPHDRHIEEEVRRRVDIEMRYHRNQTERMTALAMGQMPTQMMSIGLVDDTPNKLLLLTKRRTKCS